MKSFVQVGKSRPHYIPYCAKLLTRVALLKTLGDIVGCVELLAGLEEDLDSLYGAMPYECPARPGEELNMSVFQLHLQR
jgi:hypothetical protein